MKSLPYGCHLHSRQAAPANRACAASTVDFISACFAGTLAKPKLIALALLSIFLEEWSPSNDSDESFAKDPPNATISVFSKDGSKVRDAVVVLKTAKLDGDRLTFDVDVLEGELTGGDGAAALFIDRFGFGGFHAGGFHAGGVGAAGFRGGYARVGARPACGVDPMSLAAPGIAGDTMRLQSAPLPWVALRWVRRQPALIPIMAPPAAIIPIRLANEEVARMRRERQPR